MPVNNSNHWRKTWFNQSRGYGEPTKLLS